MTRSVPTPTGTRGSRPGTLAQASFTYTLTFDGFGGAFITITGP